MTSRTDRLGDRIVGAGLALLAVWAYGRAGTFDAGFTDPLGPTVFPRAVAVALGLLALAMAVFPAASARWPRGAQLLRQAAAMLVMILYAAALRPAGFLPVTAVAAALLGRLFGAGWGPTALSGAGMSLGIWALFEYVLGLGLPDTPGLGV